MIEMPVRTVRVAGEIEHDEIEGLKAKLAPGDLVPGGWFLALGDLDREANLGAVAAAPREVRGPVLGVEAGIIGEPDEPAVDMGQSPEGKIDSPHGDTLAGDSLCASAVREVVQGHCAYAASPLFTAEDPLMTPS